MSAERKPPEEALRNKIVFLVNDEELEILDNYAKKEFQGNRSLVLRDALIDYGLFKKPK